MAWSPPIDQAFVIAFASAAELKHPKADFPISLMVDTCNTHVGAVLQHFCCWPWALLSFFNKKLTPAVTRYSAFDRMLLAIYAAI